MNRVPPPSVRIAASLMALLLLAPLALPLVSHAAASLSVSEHAAGGMDMDMTGDMPCPPRGEEVSSCCMQTGLVTTTPAVPHRQQALIVSMVNGLATGAFSVAYMTGVCQPTGFFDRELHRVASLPPLHILNASFLL